MQVKDHVNDELGAVTAWRRDQLVGAGFPRDLAAAIAAANRFDVHALIELTERGCPPQLAVRIVAPLDSAVDAA